jgi:predicted ATP-binding protein involved in virulence
MQLKSLTLTQFRAFKQATFYFQPGMNLLVGINGVGKSSVLDALRIILSRTIPDISVSKKELLDFNKQDIAFGSDWLRTELRIDIINNQFEYEVRRWEQEYGTINVKEGDVRHQTDNRSNIDRLATIDNNSLPQPLSKILQKQLKNAAEQPLAVYFSTRRSLPNMDKPSKQSIAGNQAAAFANALDHREMRLIEFAEWWLAQKALAIENAPLAQRHLNVLEEAVTHFLDTCSNLHAVRDTKEYEYKDKAGSIKKIKETKTTLFLKKAGLELDVCQFSDGERGILALVLDLARRLSQANPKLENPLRDAKAVVLIDELDLHLHPRWQRTIVNQLTQTFPNCQFIATTHSPQIVGEVPPESILLLESGQQPLQPNQSLGMDTNWVLRYLMGAATRDSATEKALSSIADMIENEEYDEATDEIDVIRDKIGEFPELVRLQTRIDRIRLLGE